MAPAFAQVGPEDVGVAPERDEIVVTALKRSANIQDVPATINAFGASQLAARQVRSGEDLISSVPSLQVNSPMGKGSPVFSLRGVTMSDYSLTQNSPVASYYDEVYKGTFPILGLAFYDLERVEVLKGPQGTLYGKNTTGGAVNIISRRPEFVSEGYVQAGYGNLNRVTLEGAAQTPITDSLAIRVAGTLEQADGWAKNHFPGAADLESVRQWGARASLRFHPREGIDFTLRASTSLQNPYSYAVIAIPDAEFGGIGGPAYSPYGVPSGTREGLGKRDVNTPDAQRRRIRNYAVALTGIVDITDDLTVTSISSYDFGKQFIHEDGDGTLIKFNVNEQWGRVDQITQDLRLSSSFSSPLNFITGAFYSYEKVGAKQRGSSAVDLDQTGDGIVDASDCIAGDYSHSCIAYNNFTQVKKSFAGYFDLTFEASQALTFRGGLRYTYDKGGLRTFYAQDRDASDNPIRNTIPGSSTDLFATTSADFKNENVSGKLGIDYKLSSDILLYTSISRGFRGASFNATAKTSPSELVPAKPEQLDAAEVGIKTEFADRSIRLNGSAFYYKYKNQQFLTLSTDGFTTVLGNLPKSRIYGAELDANWTVTDRLTLSSSVGLINTRVIEGALFGVDLKGKKLLNAPDFTASASVDWEVPLRAWGTADVHVDISNSSKQYYDIFNADKASENGFTLANGRVRVHPDEDRYGVALWIKNAFNAYYYVNRYDTAASFGYDYTHVNEPRTFGITFDAKF
tara:strand:+ start:1477 stop:3702 length:2226 start_codon:yes stop_codon:yes gene_type:complete